MLISTGSQQALDLAALFGHAPAAGSVEVLSRVLAERGAADLSASTLSRWLDALVASHRPGAASRLLAALGPRADDSDLAAARSRVLAAEADPDAPSREANRERVLAWLAAPEEATASTRRLIRMTTTSSILNRKMVR